MNTADLIAWIVVTLLSGAGIWLLRMAWRRQRANRRVPMIIGLLALVAATAATLSTLGPARGPTIALMVVSSVALVIIAFGMKVKPSREAVERQSPEPKERPTPIWRGFLRVLIGGPIGVTAAMGIGLAWTAWLPAAPETRAITGELLAMTLWAGALSWALADDKIMRVGAALTSIALVTGVIAALKVFA